MLAFYWGERAVVRMQEGETASVVQTGLLPELAAHLDKHPRDARAWAILARLEFARGDYPGAVSAYAHAVELPGKVARDPLVWCEYADAVALAADGRLAGKPRGLIDHALALNSRHPRALEMAGSAEVEAGNFTAALGYWEELLAILPAESPARPELARAVELYAHARRPLNYGESARDPVTGSSRSAPRRRAARTAISSAMHAAVTPNEPQTYTP